MTLCRSTTYGQRVENSKKDVAKLAWILTVWTLILEWNLKSSSLHRDEMEREIYTWCKTWIPLLVTKAGYSLYIPHSWSSTDLWGPWELVPDLPSQVLLSLPHCSKEWWQFRSKSDQQISVLNALITSIEKARNRETALRNKHQDAPRGFDQPKSKT